MKTFFKDPQPSKLCQTFVLDTHMEIKGIWEYKFAHWNGGSSYLMNKQAEIETIIAGYKPSVLGISECCFKQNHSIEDVSIEQ